MLYAIRKPVFHGKETVNYDDVYCQWLFYELKLMIKKDNIIEHQRMFLFVSG